MDPYSGSIFDPMSLHKYLYANANPITYSDPTGNFSLAELNVAQAIDKILDNMPKINYAKIFNTINNVLTVYDMGRTIVDAILNSESIEEMMFSVAIGMVSSIAINKACGMKALGPVAKRVIIAAFSAFGIGGEIAGIVEAFENEDYDLVVTRSIQLVMSVASLIFFNCFTGETLVATEYGQKRIDEIEVGDLVWSANVETGEVELKEVTEVFVNETDTLVCIAVNGNIINTTEGHPFYVDGKGWIEAIELEIGDKLILLNGEIAIIEDVEIECLDESVKIYNFTVDEQHTYFVGNDNILVHNACERHHIASDKSKKTGYTDKYKAVFDKAGIKFDDDINIVLLENHKGRHTNNYKDIVLQMLNEAVDKLEINNKNPNKDEYYNVVSGVLNELRITLLANPRFAYT